ncbi:NAD(+) salvage pathway protein [Collariella sp. IMI 366227]|nr:NAD(+) salvage pathway protein [Collariella sp. IMI 366227]
MSPEVDTVRDCGVSAILTNDVSISQQQQQLPVDENTKQGSVRSVSCGPNIQLVLVLDKQGFFAKPSHVRPFFRFSPVPDGRAITPLINTLLSLTTFTLKIATKDWHPQPHLLCLLPPFISTQTPLPRPHNHHQPLNPSESYTTRLWPAHCIQHTPGAELIPELNTSQLTHTIDKGTDPAFEMYSAFYAPLQNPRAGDTGLAKLLREHEITHVYVVGLAGDYCVRCTAEDAAREGFETFVIEEGTRAVDPEAWEGCKREMEGKG